MREREVYMLYEMNIESHIVIETPVGMAYSITVHEIVLRHTHHYACPLCIIYKGPGQPATYF